MACSCLPAQRVFISTALLTPALGPRRCDASPRLGFLILRTTVNFGGHLPVMVSTNYEIIFEPKPRKIGREWRVVATYPSGQKEHITGFASEGEAIEWLASKSSQVWRMARFIACGYTG